jgi:hypothetical protein
MSLTILTFSLCLEYPSFCETIAMFKFPNSEVASFISSSTLPALLSDEQLSRLTGPFGVPLTYLLLNLYVARTCINYNV